MVAHRHARTVTSDGPATASIMAGLAHDEIARRRGARTSASGLVATAAAGRARLRGCACRRFISQSRRRQLVSMSTLALREIRPELPAACALMCQWPHDRRRPKSSTRSARQKTESAAASCNARGGRRCTRASAGPGGGTGSTACATSATRAGTAPRTTRRKPARERHADSRVLLAALGDDSDVVAGGRS